MKKILYIVLVLVVSSIIFSACTKEEVKPIIIPGGTIDPIKE